MSYHQTGKEYNTIPARSGMAVCLLPNQTLRVINTFGTQVVDTWAFMCDGDGDGDGGSKINIAHHMSQSHTRACLNRFSPVVGDVLYTNRRQPILQLVEDTSPGVHDTVIAACDIWRYRELSGCGHHLCHDGNDDDDGYYHESCAENLAMALKKIGGGLWSEEGVDVSRMPGWGNGPDPLNLWMNIPIHLKGEENEGGGGGKEANGGEEQGRGRGRGPGVVVSAQVSPSAGTSLSFEKPVSKAGDYVRLKNVSGHQVVVVMSACPQDLLEINCRVPTSVEFVVEE